MSSDFPDQRKIQLTDRYELFVAGYQRYLKKRGFGNHLNDSTFVQRGFLTCWFEPGFHHFWRAWNPGISYFCYRFYRWLGGSDHREMATIVVFLLNGLLHNLVVSIFSGCWSFPLPFTFLSFGLLTVASRRLSNIFDQGRLPPWLMG